jgi:uncharacterized membrane protein YjgN (DUF898 family)
MGEGLVRRWCVMTTADVADPAPSAAAVQFLGSEADYWRLRIKGAALLMVTLGLYRFWFATDVRRFLWSNTEIGGETLEYTGLATELLGGFLLALAILVPLYTAVAGAALALDTAEQLIGMLTFLLLIMLGQFALYRARRYRLTRTVFRGVRFEQHGAAWRYALFALFWWGIVIVTLGLAYPWQRASLERYKMHRTSYGDLAGAFEGSGWALFLRGAPIWLLVIGPILLGLVALAVTVDWNALNGAMATGGKPVAVGNAGARAAGIIGVAFGVSALAIVLLYPLFQAIMMRWWISGLRFGPVSITSRLRSGKVYRIYLRFLLYIALYIIALAIVGVLAALLGRAIIGADHGSVSAELLGTTVTLVLYVVTMLGASTIYQVVVSFAMWRLGAQTAELSGAEALNAVRATGSASSALGEGLADALGVGGI